MKDPLAGTARSRLRHPRAATLGIAASLVLALAGCTPGASDSASETPASGGGAEITMWVRSATDQFSQRLVDGYNASHDTQVNLTIIPNDSYLQKVGAAAGAKSLPDILAADVVYAPNYVKQGLYADISDKVEALSFYDTLVQAHTEAATLDGKIYGVPHKVDSSLIVYNKDLYTQAGLDPDKPPASFEDLYNDAKAIRGIGGDTYGFYYGGNCAGCMAYTTFPFSAAAGHDPFQEDGAKADFDNAGFNDTWALYKKLADEDLVPSSAKTEDGSTWPAQFLAGKIGILPIGTFVFGDLQSKATFDWGVAPLMSPDGSGASTFVGGDILGVSATSSKADAAWDFISWTLGDEAQVDIVAKNGDLPARTDLAANEYSSADPRIVQAIEGLADGYTPSALAYSDLINNGNGPWSEGFRGAIYGEDPTGAAATMQEKIQAGLDTTAG